jgi:chromosomal replication initiator protein
MCRHWFDDIEPIDLTGGVLKLLVRELVQLRYLQQRCLSQFTEAAQAATGRLLAVRFVGEADLTDPEPLPNGAAGWTGADEHMLLSPDHSFDHFIVGPGNRLAHAASLAVAREPGRAYNPLFIYGGVGLGKTHLLQAICQAAIRGNPHLNLYYTSCDGFMTQFLSAVQSGRMNEFRHHFRHVDMLVIDDIHDLCSRDTTQEEFFHTFNSLHQMGRQVVLSSDAPPNQIPDLQERLVSRFNSGLVAGIEKPCFETRVAIIKSKAALRNLRLPDEVATFVAQRIDTNIRELEGAIVKLQGLATVHNVAVDARLARQTLGEFAAPSNGSSHPTIQTIIDVVTAYYDVKLADLLSKRRQKSIALPRQVAMWLARKHTRYSLEEIGGYFGGRDHTTVMHAVRTVNERRSNDSSLDQDVARLEDQVAHSGH